jgi:VanZ family protein
MRFLAAWGPLLLWAALMLAGSSIPNLCPPSFLNNWDSLFHLAEFAVFSLLFYRSLRLQGLGNGRSWLVVCAASTAMAAVNELHKLMVPGRHTSVIDFITDLFGVLAGLGLVQAGFGRKCHEQIPGDQGHV